MTRWRLWTVASAIVLACATLVTPAAASVATTPRDAMPAAAPAVVSDADPLQTRASALVREMTVAEQAASVVMGHIPTTDVAELHAYMQQGLGGFILMGSNIPPTEAELAAVTAALAIDPTLPPLVAIDQEGGIVSRLHDDRYAASTTLKNEPVAATHDAFAARASLAARVGITVNFGTVADVPSDTSSFIFGRALGAEAAAAAVRVAAATSAQEPFLASTLKHFPGHGAAPGDSHSGIPSTPLSLEQWRAADSLPFIAGIDAGASLLMFGHLAYTGVDPAPASLSAAWHDIARTDLGFDGVIVTDDLGMLLSSGDPAYADPVANGVMAIAAGNDLVLMIAGSDASTAQNMATGIAAAVDSGALPAERLEDAAVRVMALRLSLSATDARWSICADCEPVG